ncbi:FAD-dependent oxidoreductase [Arthrobacter sp. R3-55]
MIGAGAIGSTTAYQLALKGQRDVLVLVQFQLGHPLRASEDHSRITHHSYHHNGYARLTRSTFGSWQRLEEASGQQVVIRYGRLGHRVEGTPGERSLNNLPPGHGKPTGCPLRRWTRQGSLTGSRSGA